MKSGGFNGSEWEGQPRIQLIQDGERMKLLVDGRLYMDWPFQDDISGRFAVVQLYALGVANYEEIAKAFKISEKSVYNYIQSYSQKGAYGLIPEKRGPKRSWKLDARLRSAILFLVMNRGIFEYEEIQRQLEAWGESISIPSIRHILLESGIVEGMALPDPQVEQAELFDDNAQGYLDFGIATELSEEAEGIPSGSKKPETARELSYSRVVMQRERSSYSRAQRVYVDRLEHGGYNSYAGGLLFVPLLEKYGFLETLRRIINISTHEGYGLEELCLSLFYLDSFGFRSMEDFKRVYPEEFGILLGRTSSPSHFTLRRFLHKVRELKQGEACIDEFSYEYLKSGIAHWGVLYIDGHFLPYYGMYPITKGWHGVRQLAMKGSYNFLGVDEHFTPWLFLIRPSSEDLLQKIPEMIAKAKEVATRAGIAEDLLDDLVVIFDREGYSAELYRFLDGRDRDDAKHRAIFISWAKYKNKWVADIPEDKFDHTVIVHYEIQKSKEVKYLETEKTMNKYGKIRTIVIESGADRKRSAIYTNAEEGQIDSDTVVRLICRRWGEENKIKELMSRHFIDYTPGYVQEPLREQPLVNNPEVKKKKQERARLMAELHKQKVKLADRVLEKAGDEMNWEQIKRTQIDLLAEIVKGNNEIFFLDQEIETLPSKIPFDQAHGGRRLLKLNYEKKRFLDCIKVFSCNMQRLMCEMLSNYYDKRKELMPALAMIVNRGGTIKLEGGRLKVRLRRFSNSEIDYAARRLCEDLNAMKPTTLDKFHMPIVYEVQ